MNNRSARQALMRATRALASISENDIRELSLFDHTLVLSALPDVTELASTRKRLAERLHQRLDALSIEKASIYEIFLVLGALWKYDPTYITGEQFACAIQRLVSAEATVGGPYYSGDTISVAANIQIAIFMRMAVRPLPNLQAFLAEVVAVEHFEDTEFTSFGLLYLLAEAGRSQELIRYVSNRWQQSQWQTAERKTIAVSILRDSAPVSEINQAVLSVCRQQKRSGFWEGEPLVRGASHYLSSHIATTTLIARTLDAYQRDNSTKPALSGQQKKRQAVSRAARKLCDGYAEPLRSSALTMVGQVCAADKTFEITLLPRLFAQALKVPVALSDQQYVVLGLANVYAWTAYTIYDDFLDSEGTPATLPVANSALRLSLECFRESMPGQDGFQRHVAMAFNEMDEANAWEVRHCRFTMRRGQVIIAELPKYGTGAQLAARSCAYTLVPRAILLQHPSASLRAMGHIESGFRNYLIARQLNDDMEDWQTDMLAGQASYVVTAILREMRVKPGTYNLRALVVAMQKQFRRTTMPHICWRALGHIEKSRRHFAGSQLLRTANGIYELLDKLELSLRRSLDVYEKARALAAHTASDRKT